MARVANIVAPREWRLPPATLVREVSSNSYDDASLRSRIDRLEHHLGLITAARREDAENFAASMAEIYRSIDARLDDMARPPEQHQPEPANDQLPAFLRRAAALSGMAESGGRQEAHGSVDVGAVIAAMNDIENGFTQRLDELTQLVNDIAHRLDMPALPLSDDPAHQHIHTIEDWLRSIDGRAARADQMAAALATEQERLRAMMAESEAVKAPVQPASKALAEEPAAPLTVDDMRRQALEAVKAAAKATRDEAMGPSADDRDVRWRLTEIGLNAGTGHERSIGLLQSLANGYAMPADDMRRALIHEHDRGSSIAVSTTVVESTCAMRLADAEEGEIPGIVANALDELARIGG